MKHVHVHKELKSKTAPPTKPSEVVGTVKQWKRYTLQDLAPKQSRQGQTDLPEQQVITLPMYTKMNKATVEAVPRLKGNVT